jgi:hypothetical protein
MPLPVKVTKDLRVLVERDVPLSGGEALELGKRLLEKGAIACRQTAFDRSTSRAASGPDEPACTGCWVPRRSDGETPARWNDASTRSRRGGPRVPMPLSTQRGGPTL